MAELADDMFTSAGTIGVIAEASLISTSAAPALKTMPRLASSLKVTLVAITSSITFLLSAVKFPLLRARVTSVVSPPDTALTSVTYNDGEETTVAQGSAADLYIPQNGSFT